jgi:Bax protein
MGNIATIRNYLIFAILILVPISVATVVLLQRGDRAVEGDIVVQIEHGLGLDAYLTTIGFNDILRNPGLLQAVPRLRISHLPKKVSKTWRENSALRKSVYFRVSLSAALQANEIILGQRERLLRLSRHAAEKMSNEDQAWLDAIMRRYRIGTLRIPIDPKQLARLARRVDALPPSLVVVQGAIESAWLQSRFAREGQAIFGQWTTDKSGLKALESDARLATFSNPHEALVAYMLNINSHPAYGGLRQARAKMRDRGQVLDGYALAGFISDYAATGQEYVALIRRMIRRDDLSRFDHAKLSAGPQIYFQMADP